MIGKYHIIVQNNRLRYEFDIKRNITIIRCDSATGKTTLINMLSSASALGESSGVDVICERPCRILSAITVQATISALLPGWRESLLLSIVK